MIDIPGNQPVYSRNERHAAEMRRAASGIGTVLAGYTVCERTTEQRQLHVGTRHPGERNEPAQGDHHVQRSVPLDSDLIYLQTVSGVDFSATEEKLSQHVADAKRHAEQARERAADHLAKARASHAAGAAGTASLPASDTASPATDEATACAQCHKPMAADDLFCGECGARRHT
ncbi:hypothetical protein [Burkholderia cepacia]|uniref:hypothetical protein n=1 Tax=Burkholderia cepacia TaxID=292 RepID=UPI001589910D|nr:hypothetical protein [Burkholderia cepacia]